MTLKVIVHGDHSYFRFIVNALSLSFLFEFEVKTTTLVYKQSTSIPCSSKGWYAPCWHKSHRHQIFAYQHLHARYPAKAPPEQKDQKEQKEQNLEEQQLGFIDLVGGFLMKFSFLDWGQLPRSQLGVLMTRWKKSSLASLTWCVGFSMMFSFLDWGQLQRQLWKDPMRRPQTSSLVWLTWWVGFSMKFSFVDWGQDQRMSNQKLLGVQGQKSSLASWTWWVKCWFFCCEFLLPRPVDSPTEPDSVVPPSPTVLPPSPTSPAEPEEPTIFSPADKRMCFGLSLESCCFFCT